MKSRSWVKVLVNSIFHIHRAKSWLLKRYKNIISGGASVHGHVLNEAFEPNPKAKRAKAMSGNLLAYFASYEEKNHRRIMFETFAKELNGNNSMSNMKAKVFTLEAEVFVERLPGLIGLNGPFGIMWTPCVESLFTEFYRCSNVRKFLN